MTIKDDTYYGKLSLDKTAGLEKRLENKISEDNAEVLYRTVTEEESFTSSPVDNTVVKSLRWNVLKKIGAKVRIVVSIPDDTADVKITLNGKELIPVTVAKTGKTVRADGNLPEGLNSAVVTVSGKTSFTATVSVTYTGYFEICREEVRLSYAGDGYIGKFSGGEYGLYSVAGLEKLFSVYGVGCASAVKTADGNFCLATYSEKDGGKIRVVSGNGTVLSEYSPGGAYTSFAVRATDTGFIVYAAKNFRLREITLSGSAITETTTAIKCKEITYAENGGTKVLVAVAPNGYSFVYEVE